MRSRESEGRLEAGVTSQEWHACQGHAWQSCSVAVNCYSYALDMPEYYWSVPGHGYARTVAPHFFESCAALFGRMPLKQLHSTLIGGAVKDGLTAIEKPQTTVERYTVALFLTDATQLPSFHWYRQHEDGVWSHKNGFRPVTNLDPEGQVIFDPCTIEDPLHPIFGGFFSVPAAGIVLQPDFPLIARPPA
jgi:hypothetical protein